MSYGFDVFETNGPGGAFETVSSAKGFIQIGSGTFGLHDALQQHTDLPGMILMLALEDAQQLVADLFHSLYCSTAVRSCCAIALTFDAACSSCCVPAAACPLACPISRTACVIWSRP